MPLHILIPIYLLLIIFSSTVSAQSESEEDIAIAFSETFVTIATGGEQQLSRAPAVATVITANDIREMGAMNLDEVLESVPGLHVSLSSLRLTPIYSIRGIQTDINPHILMLINGVPLTQMWQGDRGPLSTLPVSSIERVEIIRGPGSAVYGADALAGVINVITKSPYDVTGTTATITRGSFGTKKGNFVHGGEYKKLGYILSIDYMKTDGDDNRTIERDAQTFWDEIMTTNASLAPGSLNTQGERLDTRIGIKSGNWIANIWNWRQEDLGVGPGLAQALDPTGYAEINNWLIDFAYNHELTKKSIVESRFSYMDIDSQSYQKLFPDGARLPIGADGNLNGITPAEIDLFSDGMHGNPGIKEQHYRFDTALFWTGMEDHRWRFAAGIFHAKLQGNETKNYGPGVIIVDGVDGIIDGSLTDLTGTDYIYAPDTHRTVYYLSLQDEWYLAPDWDLTAGMRFDKYSDFGNTINPRAALVWHPSYKLTTKLLYGRAFRAPSFQELYVQNNPVIDGNKDLDAEKINTLELAFDYQHTFNVKSNLSFFTYELEDLIEYVSDGSGVPRAENVGEQRGRGIEYEINWTINDSLKILSNFALQKAEDTTDNSDSPNSPQKQFYTRLNWKFYPEWSFNIQLNRVMDRQRSEGDEREELKDYTIVNLLIKRTRLAENWNVDFKVNNLFNQEAKEPSPSEVRMFMPGDYPLEGRAYYLTIGYQI